MPPIESNQQAQPASPPPVATPSTPPTQEVRGHKFLFGGLLAFAGAAIALAIVFFVWNPLYAQFEQNQQEYIKDQTIEHINENLGQIAARLSLETDEVPTIDPAELEVHFIKQDSSEATVLTFIKNTFFSRLLGVDPAQLPAEDDFVLISITSVTKQGSQWISNEGNKTYLALSADAVLESLHTARESAQDALIKEQMSSLRTAAEIYWVNNNSSYIGFEKDPKTLSTFSRINDLTPEGMLATCQTSKNAYRCHTPTKSGMTHVCVNSSGEFIESEQDPASISGFECPQTE